jgi:starch synthase
MPAPGAVRVLGISVPDVSDWRQDEPAGKWSPFYAALAQRFALIDVIQPELSIADRSLNLARAFHPRRHNWSARAGANPFLVRRRTEAVQRGLDRYQGSYDLIVQLQTLCEPGFDRAGAPYTIYTDSTLALNRRVYPEGVGLSPDAIAAWMTFDADVCRSASVVFTFSEFARRSVIDDYGCSAERVVAVGAGANQFLPELDDGEATTPRALFVGADFGRKGGQVLLEAWNVVREHVGDAELIIAGPRRDPTSAGLAGVRWVGRVDRAALADLYRSASVFVLPSLFEPWGHVFLEAMGYGLPCVGTSCCAMPEIIADGVTGILVARGSVEALAAALIDLLADRDRARALGRAGYAKVMNGYRWSDVIDRVAAHLPPAPASSLSTRR